MTQPIIIYSHGFGVDHTDRGLFTDIAAALPGFKAHMFAYNDADPETGYLVVRPLSEQAVLLRKEYDAVRAANPDAEINLICHSQGCIVAGLAALPKIARTIFLTPLHKLDMQRTIARTQKNPNTIINLDGMSRLGRTDGSVTLVLSAFWREASTINPMELYKALVPTTRLTIFRADADTVLGDTDLSALPNVVTLPGNHDFSAPNRKRVLDEIKKVLDV